LTPINFSILEIVKRAQNSDSEAMMILLDQFEPLLNKYAKKLAVDYDYDYEDARQEVILAFIELIKKWKLSLLSDNSNGTIIAYITKSLHNSYIRISKKTKPAFVEMLEIVLIGEHQTKHMVSDSYDLYREEITTVLSERELLVLHLYCLQDIPIKSVAKLLNVSRQAAYKTKNKAVEKLREFYGEGELL
jgi:RNA polymerase sigma factor (sigma-70 family)